VCERERPARESDWSLDARPRGGARSALLSVRFRDISVDAAINPCGKRLSVDVTLFHATWFRVLGLGFRV